MDILPPIVAEDHPDRLIWCEFAMQTEFLMLAQRAKELGWRDQEIAVALVNLADNNMLALIANGRIEDALTDTKTTRK
jgi:CDP-diacylglycerol pyrophosphatase